MTMPDRDVPGISATACQRPNSAARRGVQSSTVRLSPPQAVAGAQEEAEEERGPADHGDGSQGVVGVGHGEGEADHHDGHGGDGEAEGQPFLGAARAAEVAERPADGGAHVVTEVEDHGPEAADMDRDVEERALVLQPHDGREEDQMARG